jgi:hypothetical protein
LGVVLPTGSPPFHTPWTARNKLLFYSHAISMPQTRSMAKASIYEGLAGLGLLMVGLCSRPMIHFGSKSSKWDRCVIALRSCFDRPFRYFRNAEGGRRDCENPINGQNNFIFRPAEKPPCCRQGRTWSEKSGRVSPDSRNEAGSVFRSEFRSGKTLFQNPRSRFPWTINRLGDRITSGRQALPVAWNKSVLGLRGFPHRPRRQL